MRRFYWFIVVVLVAVLAGVTFYLYTKGQTIEEVVELAARGGEIKLREEMRPVEDGPRVLVFAFDGIGANEFYRALGGSATPRLRSLLGEGGKDGLFERLAILREVRAAAEICAPGKPFVLPDL